MNKLAQWVLNSVVGIFFFFVFLIFYFPFDTIIQDGLTRIETQTGGRYRLMVKKIEPSLFFKTVFRDFELQQIEKGESKVLITLPEVRVGIHYLPLLYQTFDASFVAKGKKGGANGRVTMSATHQKISAELDDFNLMQIPILASFLKVPLHGALDGELDFSLYPGQMTKNEGEIDLKFKSLKIVGGHVVLYPGFELDLPDLDLSKQKDGRLMVNLSKGKLDVKEISFPGEDLVLQLKGQIEVNAPFAQSKLSLMGSFKPSDKLKEALPLFVVIDKQKTEDGSYPIALEGRFGQPQIKIGTFDVL